MKLEIYKSIIYDIQNYKGSFIGPFRKLDKILHEKYPSVSKETIASIFSHFFRKKMKFNHRKHIRSKYNLYKRFTDDISKNEPVGVILRLADEISLSPALLARIILEVYYEQLEENKLSLEEYSRASLLCRDETNEDGNISESESDSGESTTPDISDSEILIIPENTSLNVKTQKSENTKFIENQINDLSIKDNINTLKNNESSVQCISKSNHTGISNIHKVQFQTWTLIEKNWDDFSTRVNSSLENSDLKDPNSSSSLDITFKSNTSREISNLKSMSFSRMDDPIDSVKIKHFLEDTSLIEDKDLSFEVFMAVLYDDQYGPNADAIKRSIGEEWEFHLKKKVEELNLPFLDEENLKSIGCDKTPDVKLEVPVAVDGYVINWIESKALFGDWDVHNQYLEEQYKSYFNRFGPGLVIYWYGFIDGLQKDRKICIRDHLPADVEIMT